jgi:hypothetical protein
MKLKEYAAKINELAQKYPDVNVMYMSDDEGNYCFPVRYSPYAGHFNKCENEFIPDDNTEEFVVNTVCIN